MGKTAVIAVGGNSLIKSKEKQEIEHQMEAVEDTANHIVDMVEKGYCVVITHGNGPQVGFGLLRSEMAKDVAPRVPLAVCGAETQGSIGYMIQQKLHNALMEKGIDKKVATVVTQVEVDPMDSAFKNPTKPIGPFYTAAEAQEKKKLGWDLVEDSGRGFRRVVPSPLPRHIVERDIIKSMVDNDFLVVAVGGGGIPVVPEKGNQLKGVPAVIDKDFASSLLAKELEADLFVISTGVDRVYLNFNQPSEIGLDEMTLEEAKKFLEEGHFPPGSMKPKIEAAIAFLENGGKEVLITSPECLAEAMEGKAGTRIKK